MTDTEGDHRYHDGSGGPALPAAVRCSPAAGSGRAAGLANLRPFPPGVSGNPSGRAKGFAAYIRQQTDDGRELVEFALDVLRGKRRAPVKVRLEALAWLADHGWGKAPIVHEVPDGGAVTVFTLRLGERELARLDDEGGAWLD
jgi:hypothetical protein